MFRGNERRRHAAERFDAERQRRHVEQQQILDVAREDAALRRRADRHDFIRIDPFVRFLPEELAHQLLHLRHARRAADEHDLVDLRRVDARVRQRLLHRRHRPLQQIVDELLELGARQLDLQMLGTGLIGRDERQIDLGFHRRRELDLGLLRAFLQTLERHAILAEIDAFALLELGGEPLDDAVVEIVAAQMRVAVGGLHLDDALAHFEDGDVEGAAAEVVDGDRFVLLLVEAVRERRGGRLVDDAEHVQPRDPARVLGGLPLRIVEIRRHGDHRVGDLLAEVILSRLLQLLQHHRRNFRRRVFLVARLDPRVAVLRAHHLVGHARGFARHLVELAPHESLDRKHRVLRVRHRLALRHLPDEALAVLGDGDDRGGDARAFLIDDDGRLPVSMTATTELVVPRSIPITLFAIWRQV